MAWALLVVALSMPAQGPRSCDDVDPTRKIDGEAALNACAGASFLRPSCVCAISTGAQTLHLCDMRGAMSPRTTCRQCARGRFNSATVNIYNQSPREGLILAPSRASPQQCQRTGSDACDVTGA